MSIAVPNIDELQSLLDLEKKEKDRLKEENEIVQEYVRLMDEGAADGFWDWDIENDTVTYSPCWSTSLGYEVGELPKCHASWQAIIHPEDVDRVWRAIGRHFERNTPFIQPIRYQHKNGQYLEMVLRGKVFRDESGRPVRMLGSRTKVPLKLQEEHGFTPSESTFNHLRAGVILLSKAGTVISLNSIAWELIGKVSSSAEQGLGFCEQCLRTEVPYGDSTKTIIQGIKSILSHDKQFYQADFISPITKQKIHLKAYTWNNSHWDGVMLWHDDMRSDGSLKKQRALYKTYSSNALTNDHKIILVNPWGVLFHVGNECQQLIRDGQYFEDTLKRLNSLHVFRLERLYGKSTDTIIDSIQSVLKGKSSFFEADYIYGLGDKHKVQAMRCCLGEDRWISFIFHNIIEQRVFPESIEQTVRKEEISRLKLRVKETDALLYTLGDQATEGFWEWVADGNYINCSQKLKRNLGYDENEEIEGSWQAMIFSQDLPVCVKAWDECFQSGVPYVCTVRYCCKNGSLIWYECRGQATRNEKGIIERMICFHTRVQVESV